MSEDAYLSTEDVAALLKVAPGTVRYWRHCRTGPRGVNLGRRVRYRLRDVEQWITDRERDERLQRAASS